MINFSTPCEIVDTTLNKLCTLLKSSEKFEKFFKSDIESLTNFLNISTDSKVRVGLIGITSSGKSTLINALLGEKLLPQKVKPSSSVLVVCSYEKVKKATIFFERDSNKKSKIITINIDKELEKFGDEHHNPNNELMVREIHLSSPKFKLSKNIALVDSPGLDAHGMQAHEKITLQLALPTLDMVLFLTTVKASSDKENLSRIDEVTQNDQFLIVVQNMIDSIEPKVVRGGEIVKNKNDIKKEHLNRIKKLLKKTEKKSTQTAEIFQISALDALKGKYKKSNIDNLIETISKNEKYLFQIQYKARAQQLLRKIDELILALNKINSKGSNLAVMLNKNAILFKDYKNVKNKIKIDVNKQMDMFMILVDNIVTTIKKINEKDIIKIRKMRDKYNTHTKNSENDFSIKIKKSQSLIIDLAEKVNLTKQDLNFAVTNPPLRTRIDLSTTQKKGASTVRKVKTLGGGIKRFFGAIFGEDDWGREVIAGKEYTVVKKEVLIASIKSSADHWKNWYYNSTETFATQNHLSLEKIEGELYLQYHSLKEKENIEIQPLEKQELITQFNTLKKHLIKITKKQLKQNKIKQNKHTLKNPDKIIKTPNYIRDLLKIAHINSYHSLYAICEFCIKKMAKEKIIIWGWDNNDTTNFVELFFKNSTKIVEQDFISNIKTDTNSLIVVNENNYNHKIHIKDINYITKIKPSIFINADLSQSGFFESKYSKSIVNKINEKKITWVIQGLEILLKNDALIEAFVNFENYLKNINSNKDLIIVSNKDPFYSLLIYELHNINKCKKILLADERAIIKRIGLDRENEVSKYIKNYIFEIGNQNA